MGPEVDQLHLSNHFLTPLCNTAVYGNETTPNKLFRIRLPFARKFSNPQQSRIPLSVPV